MAGGRRQPAGGWGARGGGVRGPSLGAMSADWWVPLVGALVGAVSAFVVSRRTLKGQADQAAVQRLEAALAELILGVQALYDPRSYNSKESPPVPDEPRVRLLLLTGSEELDEQLRWVCVGWLSRWRVMNDFAWDLAGETGDEDMRALGHKLRRLAGELVPALRKLKSPKPKHVRATLRALGEWRGRLEDLEAKHRNDAELWSFQVNSVPLNEETEAALDSREGLSEMTALACKRELNVTEQEELNRRRRAVRLLDLQEWGWANPLSPAEVAEREGLEPVVEEDWVVQREVNVRRRAGQAKPEG